MKTQDFCALRSKKPFKAAEICLNGGVKTFQHMQSAVDVVQTSPHPENKIAATIAGTDKNGAEFALSRTNFWPPAIAENLGTQTRIGDASGTVHAETACILATPRSDGAALFITDPPCPNCVKNMAEAGIKTLYIDHKGFDKDFAVRRGDAFASLSLRICEKAGISVYRLFRKEERLEEILVVPRNFVPPSERPPTIEPLSKMVSENLFAQAIADKAAFYDRRHFALAIALDANRQSLLIAAESHPCPGYTGETMEVSHSKYNMILQPLNRVLMLAARHGLEIKNEYVYSSRVPTSREMVDLLGAGLSTLHIGNTSAARDTMALYALDQLSEAGALKIA